MELKLEVFGSLCEMSEFVINGVEAEHSDFGSKYDASPDTDEEYGCGDMKFEPVAPTAEVLAKYKIDELEYWSIANELANRLSFGSCGWCI